MAESKTKSKLKEAKSKSRTSATIRTETRVNREPPPGAKILTETVTTETEQIENGYLLSKNYDVSYEINGEKNWTYYCKKWFSKTDPLKVTIDDKALADNFDTEY